MVSYNCPLDMSLPSWPSPSHVAHVAWRRCPGYVVFARHFTTQADLTFRRSGNTQISARANQAGLVGEDDELRPVPGSELGHGPAGVGFYRCRADVDLAG